MDLIADILGILGAFLIAYGAFLVAIPLGFAVLGSLLIAIAVAVQREERPR